MRSSYLRTLLFLLPALLLLSACQATPPLEPVGSIIELTDTVDDVSAELKQVPHLELATSYVGTTELTGANDGPEVERFLSNVGLPAGNPYCAAFVSYILDETPNVTSPMVRSGLAYHFITNQSISAKDVLRGVVEVEPGTLLIWRKGNTIYGHIGFVERQISTNKFTTIEANTSSGVYGNQSNGDGVWRRQRSIQPTNYFRITDFTLVTYNS